MEPPAAHGRVLADGAAAGGAHPGQGHLHLRPRAKLQLQALAHHPGGAFILTFYAQFTTSLLCCACVLNLLLYPVLTHYYCCPAADAIDGAERQHRRGQG